MTLRGKIDDVLGISEFARFIHKHTARLDFAAIAGPGIGREILGEHVLKLERDTAPHHADTIDGIHKRFHVSVQNVASTEIDHVAPISVVPALLDFDSGSMVKRSSDSMHLVRDGQIDHANPTDQMPGKAIMHEKLRLLCLLYV